MSDAVRPRLDAADLRLLVPFAVLGVLRAVALVLVAEGLATGVVRAIAGEDVRDAALLATLGALLRGVLVLVDRVVADRAAAGRVARVRRGLLEHAFRYGIDGRAGGVAGVATAGLDGLRDWTTTVLPAIASAATVPVLVGLRILGADWPSALLLVVTVPLVPVFMAIIGLHTADRSAEAVDALARLSDHLVELARGLPVLVGLRRVDEQARSLEAIGRAHRDRTMATLRLAFLSSLALEIIATLGVALVAVVIGVRLVHGEMPLATGLLVLLLAPEVFSPLRDVGAAFHAAQDGLAAKDRVDRLTAVEPAPDVRRSGGTDGAVIRIEGLTVRYAERAVDAVGPVTHRLRPGAITAVTGGSGAGKSTLLAALAGLLPPGARVAGRIEGVPTDAVAWLPQHPRPFGATVDADLRLAAADSPAAARRIPELRRDLGLDARADDDPALLSPGELRRLALARVLLRVDAGARIVLLDEPTAHLDATTAAVVRDAIAALAGRASVVLVSHDPRTTALATDRIALRAGLTSSSAPPPAPPVSTVAASAALGSDVRGGAAPAVPLLARLVRPAAGRMLGAGLIGACAALAAAALTALSGWLIVQAATQPPILTLMTAIVGVRFFGLARAVLRYCERLVGHDGALLIAAALRMRIWHGLAANAADRGETAAGRALARLVADTDTVRDLLPRVLQPVVAAIATGAAAGLAALLLHAPAAMPVLLAATVGAVVVPALALAAGGAAEGRVRALRSALVHRFTTVVLAVDELRTNGLGDAVLRIIDADERAATRAAARSARAAGSAAAAVAALAPLTAVAVLLSCAASPPAGALAGPVIALLVLLPLGLAEPFGAAADAVRQAPALMAAARRADPGTGDEPPTAPRAAAPASADRLVLDGLAARWPGTAAPVFAGLRAETLRGTPLVVTGPSGSGKSTLASVLLGQLPPDAGAVLLDGAPLPAGAVAWCPQEAHLFDSTLRANLDLARDPGLRGADAPLVDALRLAGLGPLLEQLPAGLDTRIGAAGAALSGGEATRVAVARALLTKAPVVVLDEPTAHLDRPTADALLRDVRAATRDRILVVITHDPADIAPGDARLDLDRGAVAVSA